MNRILWWIVGIVVLVAVTLFAGRVWQRRGNEQAVAREREAETRVAVYAAAANAANARADSTDKALTDSLAYWHGRPRLVVTRHEPLPATSSDTATLGLLQRERAAREAVEALLADVEARGNAIDRSCTALQRDCAAVRVSADSLRLAYAAQVKALRAVIAHPPARRKWGIGCGAGYGGVLSAGLVRVGPGGTCGVTLSF